MQKKNPDTKYIKILTLGPTITISTNTKKRDKNVNKEKPAQNFFFKNALLNFKYHFIFFLRIARLE